MDYKSDLKKLQSLKNKKYRQQYGQFLIEGEKIIEEALDSNFDIDGLWINKEGYHKIRQKALEKGIDVKFVNQSWIERAGSLKSNKVGLGLLKERSNKESPDTGKWILVLDSINDIGDPGNLGTIIRIMDWYGLTEIVCSTESVDQYNPKVLMASKGSFLRVNVFYKDLREFLSTYSGNIWAADMLGEDLHNVEEPGKNGILLMGSESHGISEELLQFIHKKITISGRGSAESLNVGMATAIILDNFKRCGSF